MPRRPFCQPGHRATCRLVGIGDNDDRTQTEITEPILDEHGDLRRRFVELWYERTSGDTGAVALSAAWQPLENMLENHASAQADVARPVLLREGSDEASNGTNDAHPVEVERDAIAASPSTVTKPPESARSRGNTR